MLNGGSLASHSSQHADKHSSAFSCHKRSHLGCFGRPCPLGSAISAFNQLAAQRYVLHGQRFSSSIYQLVVGAIQASAMKVYQQCWREWLGWCASIILCSLNQFILFIYSTHLLINILIFGMLNISCHCLITTLFFSIVLLFSFLHLVARWID